MSDLIYRQDAIEGICKEWCGCDEDQIKRCNADPYRGEYDSDKFHCDGCDDVVVIRELPSAQPEQHGEKIFQGIIVEYPSICTYPEYKGKPYFSIKYIENGQCFIGFGTYKPEVLSEYLKEYFMLPVQSDHIADADKKGDLISRECLDSSSQKGGKNNDRIQSIWTRMGM